MANAFLLKPLIPAKITMAGASGSRTNLAPFSQQLDQWFSFDDNGPTYPIVTTNAAVAPDGTMTAERVMTRDVALGSYSMLYQANSLTLAATEHTYSIWLRGDVGGEQINLLTQNPNTSKQVTLTNQWVRYSVTFFGGQGGFYPGIGTHRAGVGSAATPAGTIYAWGGQLETGIVATDYIPTTGGPVTVTLPAVPDIGVAANLLNDYAGVIAATRCNGSPDNRAQITVDLGADMLVDTIMVFGVEQFPATGAIIIDYASAAQGAFNDAFTTSATGAAYAGAAEMTAGKGVSYWSLAAPVAARYIRLNYAANVAGRSIRASRLVIGRRIRLERNFGYGAAFGVRDLGSLDFSRRGVMLRSRGAKLRTVGLTFSHVRKDELEAQLAPLLEQLGNTDPVALVTDPAADAQRQNRCFFGPLVGDLSITRRTAVANEAKINLVSMF